MKTLQKFFYLTPYLLAKSHKICRILSAKNLKKDIPSILHQSHNQISYLEMQLRYKKSVEEFPFQKILIKHEKVFIAFS